MEIFFTPLGFLMVSVGLIAALSLVSRPIIGLVAVVVVAVLIEYATLNWTLMAGVSALFVSMIALGVLNEKHRSWMGRPTRLKTQGDKAFAIIGALAIIYLVVGIVKGNDRTFLLGDFYHLIFELCLPFFLFTVFVKSRDDIRRFHKTLAVGMLGLGVVVLALYFSGTIQALEGGGQTYRHTDIWRLRLSHNFPLPPLLWILPTWLVAGGVQTRRTTGIAILVVLAALIVTLKRTAWIAATLVAFVYVSQISARDRARIVMTVGALGILGIIVASTMLPKEVVQGGLGFEQYAEVVTSRFSTKRSDVDVSVGNRQTELASALEIALRFPFGHGLGSEFEVQQRMGELYNKRHYIHNSFIHYFLQVGFVFPLVVLWLTAKVAATGFRLLRTVHDPLLRASTLSALGAYGGVFIASMTELSIHTFFFAYSAAMLFVVDRVNQMEQAEARESGGSRELIEQTDA